MRSYSECVCDLKRRRRRYTWPQLFCPNRYALWRRVFRMPRNARRKRRFVVVCTFTTHLLWYYEINASFCVLLDRSLLIYLYSISLALSTLPCLSLCFSRFSVRLRWSSRSITSYHRELFDRRERFGSSPSILANVDDRSINWPSVPSPATQTSARVFFLSPT